MDYTAKIIDKELGLFKISPFKLKRKRKKAKIGKK